MAVHSSAFLLWLFPLCLWAQELNLEQYLRRLKTAPGVTLADKVEFLSAMGVSLSDRGMRELERASNSAMRRSGYGQADAFAGSASSPTWAPHRTDTVPALSKSRRAESDGPWSLNSYSAGGSEYHSTSDGVSGTSRRFGNYTYHSFSNGLSGTTTEVGNYRYHNFNNGLSGATSRIGQFEYHDFSGGLSGTSRRIGNFTYHDYNDGTRCVTTRLGQFTNTDCNR